MKTNLLIAATIVILLTLWMSIGSLLAEKSSSEGSTPETPLPSVRFRDSVATEHTQKVSLRGKTIPSRTATLRAEISGAVERIDAERGDFVKKGDPIIRINEGELPEQLLAAEAMVTLRTQEFDAATRLTERGLQSQTRQLETASLLEQAKAERSRIRKALNDASLKAPFDGVILERFVEVGEYASPGDPLVSFLELDPIVVSAEATEVEVATLTVDQVATAVIQGKRYEGRIRYVAPNSNATTRTFTVELEIPNSENELKAGLTAKVEIDSNTQLAHYVSPALLYLSADTDGNLGLKVVDDDDRVVFFPTEILAGDSDGVWVTGLPSKTRIITVGQGFVIPGAKVEAIKESTIQ